jgi:CRP-like cAMP-binding protein
LPTDVAPLSRLRHLSVTSQLFAAGVSRRGPRSEAMPSSTNLLLAHLEPTIRRRLEAHLMPVKLAQGEALAETRRALEKVYFPRSGIISCLVHLSDGQAIEAGMIGRDGQFGGAQALDDKICLNRVVMQIAGEALVVDADIVRRLAEEFPAFRKLIINYELFFLAQVQQTAACNAVHKVQERMCKWLLRMHDLAGPDLSLTQEYLAEMMGVRRTSVSDVATELQRAGMITYSRGRLQITDLAQIRRRVCECDNDVRSHYQKIFHPPGL